jgi:hypothetical protein
MESQRGRNQVDERRRLLQFQGGKIALSRDFSTLQMAPDAQPIIGRLQRQVNMLAGFQFNDRQPSSSCDRQEIENAVFAASIGENLRVDETLIPCGIHPRDVLANDGFQPALRLRAVARMARLRRKRVTMDFEIVKTAHFPGHSRERCDPAVVLPHFHDTGGNKLLKAGLQFRSKFHGQILNDIRILYIILFENSLT